MTTISSARDLLECGELVDIRVLEFSAAVREEPNVELEEDDVSQNVSVGLGVGDHAIEVRMNVTVDTRTAAYTATVAMQYRYESENEPSEPVVREFAERAGLAAVYPYVREVIQSNSVKIRQSPITMPFMPLGGTTLNPGSES